jgi:chorismate mutase-like protein
LGATVVAMLAVAMPAAADPLADAVFAGIAERLALMEPVAAWKRINGAAVEDLAREAVVLEEAAAAAEEAGLVAETARPFFEGQIEAAKEIQRCWIARWNAGAPLPRPPPDLMTDIRPRLLEIGAQLLDDIEAALLSGMVFDQTLAADFATMADLDCLSPAARDAVYRELAGVRLQPG